MPNQNDKNDGKSVPAKAAKLTEEKASISRDDQKQEENTKNGNRFSQGSQRPPKHGRSNDDVKDRGYRGQDRSGRGRADRNKVNRRDFERNRPDRERPHQERFYDQRSGPDRMGENRHSKTQHATQQQGHAQQPDDDRPEIIPQSNQIRPDLIRKPVQTLPSQTQSKQTQHVGQTERQGEAHGPDRNQADKPSRFDQARPDSTLQPYQNQPNQAQRQDQTHRPVRYRPEKTQRSDQTRFDTNQQTDQSHSNGTQTDSEKQDRNVNKTAVTTQNNYKYKRMQDIRMDSFGPAEDEKRRQETSYENNSGQRRRNFSPNRKPKDNSNEEGADEDNKRTSRKSRRNRKRREGGPNSREAGIRGRNDSTSDGDPNWRVPVREENSRDADVRGAEMKRVASITVNEDTSSVVDAQKRDKSQVASGNDSKMEGSEKIEKNEIIVTIDSSSEGRRTVSEKKPTTNVTQHEGLPQRQRNNRRNRNKSWYEKVEEDKSMPIRNGHVDFWRGNRRVSNETDRGRQGKENTLQSKLVTDDASACGKNQINGHTSEKSADKKPEVDTQKPEVKTITVDSAKSMNDPLRSTEKQMITCNGHDQTDVVSERKRKRDRESEVKREERSINAVKDVNGNY